MNSILKNQKIVIAVLVIFLTVFSLYAWQRPMQVEAFKVTEQDYVPSLLLSGEVIVEGSTLLSSPRAGKVLACPVVKGEQVLKGQVLVQLDDSQAQIDRDRVANAVQTAAAQLEKALTVTYKEASAKKVQMEVDLEQTTINFQNIQVLAENGAASRMELEQAERDLRLSQELDRSAGALLDSLSQDGAGITILQAELNQRQLDLKEKDIILSEYKITAPADGQLLDLYVQPGELLTASSSVALLAAGSGLRVKVQPDQRYASMAALDNYAQVWVTNNPSRKWDAKVVYIEPLANPEQGSFTAELAFAEYPSSLTPGQLLSVQLFAPAQAHAVILSEKFLTMREGKNGAWTAIEGKAQFIPLQLGIRTENGVVISSGLQAGDLVLVPEGLEENQRVTPRQGKV